MQIHFFFVLVLFFSLNSVCYGEVALRSTVTVTPASARLKKAIDSALPSSKLSSGIIVGSLSTGDLLFERNGDELFIPASVNKLFTAFTALKKLRPTATFKTTIYITGSLKEGVLTGDLYIK